MANMDISYISAVEAIRENPEALTDSFNFSVFVDYMQRYGAYEAGKLLDPYAISI